MGICFLVSKLNMNREPSYTDLGVGLSSDSNVSIEQIRGVVKVQGSRFGLLLVGFKLMKTSGARILWSRF